MNNEYRKQADIAEGSFFSAMSAMANIRLDALCSEWRIQFPKCSLKILFGNGAEFAYINGESVSFWERVHRLEPSNSRWSSDCELDLSIVADALEDVRYITKNYERGRPDDIEVSPDNDLGGTDDQTNYRKTSKNIFRLWRVPRLRLPASCPCLVYSSLIADRTTITYLEFADTMENGIMISRPKNFGRKSRRKVSLANLDVRISQGPSWWTDRGYSPEDADVKLRIAKSEASVLEERTK